MEAHKPRQSTGLFLLDEDVPYPVVVKGHPVSKTVVEHLALPTSTPSVPAPSVSERAEATRSRAVSRVWINPGIRRSHVHEVSVWPEWCHSVAIVTIRPFGQAVVGSHLPGVDLWRSRRWTTRSRSSVALRPSYRKSRSM